MLNPEGIDFSDYGALPADYSKRFRIDGQEWRTDTNVEIPVSAGTPSIVVSFNAQSQTQDIILGIGERQ